MENKIYKIKRLEIIDLLAIVIAFGFYVTLFFYAIKDWQSLGDRNFVIFFLLIGAIYFVFYFVYIFSNRIEIDYDKQQFSEKLLNFTIDTLKINEIEKMSYEFPRKNIVAKNKWVIPNYREMSIIRFVINGKNIKRSWLIGRGNTIEIIKDLMLINKKIEKISAPTEPALFAKKNRGSGYFIMTIVLIPLVALISFLLIKFLARY